MQAPQRADLQFRFSPSRIASALAAVTILLVTISWVTNFAHLRLGYGNLLGIRIIFDVGNDISIPTWYSGVALLFASVLLWIIALDKRRSGAPFTGHWVGLAIIFLLMSIDETGGVHERAGHVVSRTFETTGIFYYGWLVLGLGFLVVFGLAYIRFVLALPRDTRRLFMLAGIVFVAGAVGVEAYNARYDELHGANNLHYMTMTTVEEFLEKLGVVVFVYALLRYLESHSGSLRVVIGDPAPTPIHSDAAADGSSLRRR